MIDNEFQNNLLKLTEEIDDNGNLPMERQIQLWLHALKATRFQQEAEEIITRQFALHDELLVQYETAITLVSLVREFLAENNLYEGFVAFLDKRIADSQEVLN